MNKTFVTVLAAFILALSACTWVKPTGSGGHVRVAYDGNVSGCRDAGAITVSVADKVAFYHRPDLKVRDELETLARNQAAGIPADTIVATSEPADGSQNFHAYVCGRVPPAARVAPPPANAAETYPVKDH